MSSGILDWHSLRLPRRHRDSALPTPLLAKSPQGSLVYDPSIAGIGLLADTDSFTLAVDPAQTITAIVTVRSDCKRALSSAIRGLPLSAAPLRLARGNLPCYRRCRRQGGTHSVSGAGGIAGNYSVR